MPARSVLLFMGFSSGPHMHSVYLVIVLSSTTDVALSTSTVKLLFVNSSRNELTCVLLYSTLYICVLYHTCTVHCTEEYRTVDPYSYVNTEFFEEAVFEGLTRNCTTLHHSGAPHRRCTLVLFLTQILKCCMHETIQG